MDTDQQADPGSVRFAPRLTEDSLPVTLPKDADRVPEATVSGDQPVTQPSSEDRRVSAGVLDLQLVPQLRELQIKHQHLQQLLQQKDAELQGLQEIADAAIGLKAQDVETNKVIELSKRGHTKIVNDDMQNRALGLALEREKQKAAGLSAELQKAKTIGNVPMPGSSDPQSVEAVCRGVVEQAAAAAEAAQKDCAAWKAKYEAALDRCNQAEFKANLCKTERDKATRALVREVGEEVPLAKVLEGGTDWRGRSQQISLLKNKIAELQQAQGMPTMSTTSARYDSQHKRAIDSMKKDKQKEVERIQEEAAATAALLETTTFKLEKAAARKNNLEREVKSLREKLSVLLDKSSTDDKLIAKLQSELAVSQKAAEAPKQEVDIDTMLQQMESLKRKYAEQVEQVARQEQVIAAIQAAPHQTFTDGR